MKHNIQLTEQLSLQCVVCTIRVFYCYPDGYCMEGNLAGGTLAIDYEFAKFIPTKLYALKLILDMFNLETAETN